jgi:hypothetical protein
MNSFHFPLQKVLDWRQVQLDLAEARFRQQIAVLAELDRERAEMQVAADRAEVEVRGWSPVEGSDLAALGAYRLHTKRRDKEIEVRSLASREELASRQAAMLEARRHCRLLERLKERRLAEWQAGADREMEAVASESFLARWNK